TQRAGLDARQVKNLEKVLIMRGTIIRPLNLNWNAGDIFEIDSKKYVVLTAAHHIDTGAIGGSMGTSSKFWIANL
ncbi:hypothetical protein RR25_19875, partial [Acinetobacter baumannii]